MRSRRLAPERDRRAKAAAAETQCFRHQRAREKAEIDVQRAELATISRRSRPPL